MGTLVELKQRVSSDWTPFERIQLESLMDCLPAKLASDIAFGVTDSGDPWCAVMDEQGEVVLHVARIQGRFYVHSTVEPFVADARDLPSAVSPFVENFKRPTAKVLPLYESIMPLPASGLFDTAPAAAFGAEWAHDAAPAAASEDVSAPTLPDAPAEDVAPAAALASTDPPALVEAAQDDAPPPFEAPAFLSQDDLTVNYELFYRAADPIVMDNAAAQLMAQAANDEVAVAAPAPAFTPPVIETPPLPDNVLTFPTPTPATTQPAGPQVDGTGLYSETIGDLVRAAAQDGAHADPGGIPAWDQPPPFELSGVLPNAEAF